MENIRKINKFTVLNFIFFLFTIVVIFVFSRIYGKSIVDSVANAILSGILLGAVIFVFIEEKINNNFLFNNIEHTNKFYISYIAAFILTLVFPLIAESGWPFLVVYVVLCVESSMLLSFVSGTALLIISIMLSANPQISTFLMYMIPGIVIVILFSTIDEEFRVINPLIIGLFTQFVCLCVSNVLIINKSFSVSLFIIPAINVLISATLILIVLKLLSFSLVYKTQDRYMDILDPEFELLVRLKNFSKEEYNHTIYTAVLCSKLATKLELDESVTKACGYYHRIGLLNDDMSWENTKDILNEYDIPIEVINVLEDYSNSETEIKSKEACVLLLADTVISSLSYLFMKDKNAEVDYERLIKTIIDKKLSSGIFNNSKISFEDLNIIKSTLIDEKLFYDFLR